LIAVAVGKGAISILIGVPLMKMEMKHPPMMELAKKHPVLKY